MLVSFIGQADLVQVGLHKSGIGCVLVGNMPSLILMSQGIQGGSLLVERRSHHTLLSCRLCQIPELYTAPRVPQFLATFLIDCDAWANSGAIVVVGSSWQTLLYQHWHCRKISTAGDVYTLGKDGETQILMMVSK